MRWSIGKELALFGDEFGRDMNERISTKTFAPVIILGLSVFKGAVVLKAPIDDESIDKVCISMSGVVCFKVVLAELDAALCVFGPVVSLLLALEGVASGGVAFDADDSAPNCGLAVFGFSFVDRCHALTFVMG